MRKFSFVFLVLVLLVAATVKIGIPKSEPVTMVLLGAVLLGLAVFARRLFLKGSKKAGKPGSWEAKKYNLGHRSTQMYTDKR